jgi:hypothetical protein
MQVRLIIDFVLGVELILKDININGKMWPQPTEASEAWRRDHIKEFFLIMGQKLSKSHEKYEYYAGFEESVSKASKEIIKELGKVTNESNVDDRRCKKIARDAANFWIKCGMQYARVYLLFSQSQRSPTRSWKNNSKIQEMVAEPELRRAGNAEGEDLERDELVSDCRGNFPRF